MTLYKEYQAEKAPSARSDGSLIGRLLAKAAAHSPTGSGRPRQASPAFGCERQLQWAMSGGLGPLLRRAAQGDGAQPLPAGWQERLVAADLTAMVTHGELLATALEVIDACERAGVPATLLKGISVSEQFWPAEHLRPMGDVDVLVPLDAYAQVEATLLARGYSRVAEPEIEGLQHGVPLEHDTRDTVVELHRSLFAVGSPLSEGTLFHLPTLRRHSRASTFHGRPVQRFSPELQLAYMAASWFNDITRCGMQAPFLISLLDATHLLAAHPAPTLDWVTLLQDLDNETANASLYTMLSYLPRHGTTPAPSTVMAELARRQRLVGPIQLRMIHATLDRYLIGGRPWTHLLPPPVPARYSPRWQFEKRVLSRFRQRA